MRIRITLGLALLSIGGAAVAQTYIVTQLAQSGYYGNPLGTRLAINANGQVAGSMAAPAGTGRAFRWTPGTPNGTAGAITNLGSYNTYDDTAAFGINGLGDVCGNAYDDRARMNRKLDSALLWQVGFSTLSLGGGGSTQMECMGINDRLDVLLYQYNSKSTTSNGVNVSRIVSGKRKTYFLGGGWPSGINNSGQVLGMYSGSGPDFGVPLWTPNVAGTAWAVQTIVPRGIGFELNQKGQVVGSTFANVQGYDMDRPFLYLPSAEYGMAAGVQDLWPSILASMPAPSEGAQWLSADPSGLNDNGAVIGTSYSFRYLNGSYQQVDQVHWIWDSANGIRLLQPAMQTTTLTLTQMGRINNSGQIAAWARDLSGVGYVVLLTPH